MTALFVWLLVSVLLIVAGGAMVVADRRRGGRRVECEESVEEVDQPVDLFQPPPRRSQDNR